MTRPTSRHAFPLIAPARAKVERLGREFEVRYLRAFLERTGPAHPLYRGALAELAQALTEVGALEDGLAADRELARLDPENPTVHYNVACSLALLGRPDAALEALEHAVTLGYDDPEHLAADEDLLSLREEGRFVALVRRLRDAARPR